MSTEAEAFNQWYSDMEHSGGRVPADATFVGGDREPDDGGWGHHSGSAVFLTIDGYIAVSCGGCSCDAGSWYISDPQPTAEAAAALLGQWFKL